MNASKIIINTFFKTLIVFIAVLIISVLLFGLIAPMQFSDFTWRLGMNGISCHYAKTAYDKSGDINDLAVVIDRSISADNADYIAVYCEKMIENEHYEDFCDFQNEKTAGFSENFDYDSYVKKYYVYSLVRTGEEEKAVDALLEYAVYRDLVYCNVLSGLVLAQFKLNDGQFADVNGHMTTLFFELEGTKYANSLCADMNTLCTLAGKTTEASVWANRFS